MKLLVALTSSACLSLLMTATNGFPQKSADKFALSISVAEVTFAPERKAKVKAKIVNETEEAVSFKDLGRVDFVFSRPSKAHEYCVLSDCFGASIPLDSGKGLGGGESLEFEVDLTDLHWKDVVLSGRDLRKPKNMFTEVPPGDYYLVMRINAPAEDATPQDPRFVAFNSNRIMITMKGKE